jgi:hypothetical protein
MATIMGVIVVCHENNEIVDDDLALLRKQDYKVQF